MRRINKVLVFFVGLFILFFFGVWKGIQTPYFAKIITNEIRNSVREKANLEITFDRFTVDFFPPSTSLENVKVRDFNSKKNILSSRVLGVSFGLFDFISKNLSIGKVFLADGVIDLPSKKSVRVNKEFKIKNIFKLYKEEVLEKLPIKIKSISLKNMTIAYDNKKYLFSKIKSNLYRNIFTVELNLNDPGLLKSFSQDYPLVDDIKLNMQVTENEVRVKDFVLRDEINIFSLKGKYKFENENSEIDLNYNLRGDVYKYKEMLNEIFSDIVKIDSGYIESIGKVKGSLENPIISARFVGADLKTNYFQFDSLRADIKIENKKLAIDNLKVDVNKGGVETLSGTEIWDFEKRKMILPVVEVKTNNLHLNDILYFLPSLVTLKGRVDGNFIVTFLNEKMLIKPKDKIIIRNIKIKDKINNNIIENKEIRINKRTRLDVFYSGRLDIDVDISFEDSFISAFGTLDGKGLDISIVNSFVNLDYFGPLSGFKLLGRGALSGKVSGPYENVNFLIKSRISDLSFLGLKLGKSNSEIMYSLKNNILNIMDFKSRFNSTFFEGDGKLDFESEQNLNLNLEITKGTVRDLNEMLNPITHHLDYILKYGKMNLSSQFKVYGSFDYGGLKVLGTLKGQSLNYMSEDFEKVFAKFNLVDEIVSIPTFEILKQQGSIRGAFIYDLRESSYDYNIVLNGLSLDSFSTYRSLNLGLAGEIEGEIYGNGGSEGETTRSHLKIKNSYIDKKLLKDSFLTIYSKGKNVYTSGKILGDVVSFDSYIDLDPKNINSNNSYIRTNIKSEELKIIFGLLSNHNINYKSSMGNIDGRLDVNFNIKSWQSLSGKFILNKFKFQRKNISMAIPEPIKININNGIIEKVKKTIKGNRVNLNFTAEGNLKNNFKIKGIVDIDASALELASSRVHGINGELSAVMEVFGNSENLESYISSKGKSISLRVDGLSGGVSDINYNIIVNNNKIYIDKFRGLYGGGDIELGGKVSVELPFPEVDISLIFNQNQISFLKKSYIVVGGDLKLKGGGIPYDFTGNISILYGEIKDELEDLAKGTGSSTRYSKYIPATHLEGNMQFVKNDISVIMLKPVEIKNSLADIKLNGFSSVKGSLVSPLLNGEFKIQNNESKFIFKGHEFFLNEGRILLSDGETKNPPQFFFSGTSKINDYDIFVEVAGRPKNMDIGLTSNPPLNQADILSLLAQGVTSDIYKNLNEKDRASVTTLSIGSLIVDQLKINQNLNDSLGLKLSVAPEIEEEGENLLSGKVEDSNTPSNVKSATKINLRKKINNKLDVGFSSTVGGTIDQKQEMDLNYKFDRSFSTELIYEVKSSDEEETENANSFGWDFKWRTSF